MSEATLMKPYLPGKWIGQTGTVKYTPCSNDLTRLDFYLWGSLMDVVYCALVCQTQRCLQANDGHLEHLFHFNLCCSHSFLYQIGLPINYLPDILYVEVCIHFWTPLYWLTCSSGCIIINKPSGIRNIPNFSNTPCTFFRKNSCQKVGCMA
jgi:hypothetical protein